MAWQHFRVNEVEWCLRATLLRGGNGMLKMQLCKSLDELNEFLESFGERGDMVVREIYPAMRDGGAVFYVLYRARG